ncbi:MAG: hypothetical protein MI867_03690 [Pseudomonadales bacterium]|nr:hypothetical protein [Pseudomonadales bacterium]
MLGKRFLVIACLTLSLLACGDTPKKEWELTAQGAYTITLSQDGKFAVVGSILHGGSLWRLKDGERLFNWNHSKGQMSEIVAAAISPNNSHAITAEKKRMVMWDIKTGRPQGFWEARGGALDVALSKDGRYALVGQENYNAVFIETASGSIVAKLAHNGDVNTVAISNNGRIGATGSEDGHVRIWDLLNEKELHSFKIGDDVSKVAISGDGRLVFGALYYGEATIWDVKTGKPISQVGFPRITLTSARFSKDKKYLLTGDTVRRAMLWDVKSGKELKTWSARPPSFQPPSGLIIGDVTFGNKPTTAAYAAFSNGKVMYWSE